MGNNLDYFQLHRFTRSENIAKVLGGLLFLTHTVHGEVKCCRDVGSVNRHLNMSCVHGPCSWAVFVAHVHGPCSWACSQAVLIKRCCAMLCSAWPVNAGSVDRAPMFTGHVHVQPTNEKFSKILPGLHVYTAEDE